MTSACKQSFKKFTFVSLGIGFLALTSSLSAENSGFYGSVGFQYSNMTRAESTNAANGYAPTGAEIANPFLNATGSVGPNTKTLPNQDTVTAGSHAQGQINVNLPKP